MAGGKVTRYNEEFRKTIVNLYKSGKLAGELAKRQVPLSGEILKEFSISSSVFYKWIKQYSEIKLSDNESIYDLRAFSTHESLSVDEVKNLQKRLAMLEEENLILKKTLSIFARG